MQNTTSITFYTLYYFIPVSLFFYLYLRVYIKASWYPYRNNGVLFDSVFNCSTLRTNTQPYRRTTLHIHWNRHTDCDIHQTLSSSQVCESYGLHLYIWYYSCGSRKPRCSSSADIYNENMTCSYQSGWFMVDEDKKGL